VLPLKVPGNEKVSPAANANTTILFADDDGSFRELVAHLLHKCGYHVIDAQDGQEALQKASEFEGPIELLLSDIDMPGMTGIELAIQLNRQRPDAKILLISSFDHGMLALNNGWQFFPKPFELDMLRDRIRAFLSEQPPLNRHLAST
jgi:two-component system, cell cycle sensor histidine kinase and response regulator CckA